MSRRVAVTGIGVVSPLGNTAAELVANAVAGRSAIRRLERPWSARMRSPLGACTDFSGEQHFEPPKLRMLDRVSQLAIVAARQAIGDARLELAGVDRSRVGIFIGTGMGGSQTTDEGYHALYAEQTDRLKPFTVLMGMTNAPAAWIGIENDVTGPNLTYSTACSSSAVSIGEAWLRLRNGELDVAIAGGAEAPLSFGALKAWEALHTLASEDPTDAATSCKPFAANRSGMVLGEGAALLILEDWERASARGAPMHGELAGYGLATDTAHITRPTVAGQAAAMRAALLAAACLPDSVDSINAHGTGTVANDAVETAAIKQVFGTDAYRIPISATKAIHGHLLGASGALELALCLLSMQHSVLLPTMHLQVPAPDCDLDYVPNRARHDVSVRTVMSNSFAFGGTNAVLVVRSPQAQ
ncbi:MAG TPA: beta-ketoacyl-[acyl-carrier-protein] synthase family protein [Steroidobacteraceae bacterium]|jgi:3-oxoacyl-[acyl-carrier-protein] synthase II|nr:beta-ketoacyl-[acyl-carrier-protein] synthase family protein [Steroidobacteraceae bacterium]